MKIKLLETIALKGMTVQVAADKADCSRVQIYQLQKRERGLDAEWIERLAKAWDVPESWLVELDDNKENANKELTDSEMTFVFGMCSDALAKSKAAISPEQKEIFGDYILYKPNRIM